MSITSMPAYLISATLLGILLSVSACRPDDGGVVRLNPKRFNAKQEAAIGNRLVSESWRNPNLAIIRPDQGAFTDPAYVYLRGLTRSLVDQPSITRRDSFEWNVHLVLGQEEHAFTLPGGQIMLYTGLLNSLKNEAECVGILAREIALAQQGAAMKALDRNVEDNVILGDMILGNVVPLDHIIEALSEIKYLPEELVAADSLAARLVCPSDYEERALPIAVSRIASMAPYNIARPTEQGWDVIFESRVSECIGADSLYAQRYGRVLRDYLPK